MRVANVMWQVFELRQRRELTKTPAQKSCLILYKGDMGHCDGLLLFGAAGTRMTMCKTGVVLYVYFPIPSFVRPNPDNDVIFFQLCQLFFYRSFCNSYYFRHFRSRCVLVCKDQLYYFLRTFSELPPNFSPVINKIQTADRSMLTAIPQLY